MPNTNYFRSLIHQILKYPSRYSHQKPFEEPHFDELQGIRYSYMCYVCKTTYTAPCSLRQLRANSPQYVCGNFRPSIYGGKECKFRVCKRCKWNEHQVPSLKGGLNDAQETFSQTRTKCPLCSGTVYKSTHITSIF